MLDDLKLLLGIDAADKSQDERLNWIINSTRSRLKLLLGDVDLSDSMNYIITEVSVIRFNRIGSEGMSSQSVDGETITFSDSDFDGYKDEIQAFLDKESSLARKGGFRFI
mgnify:FL=1